MTQVREILIKHVKPRLALLLQHQLIVTSSLFFKYHLGIVNQVR